MASGGVSFHATTLHATLIAPCTNATSSIATPHCSQAFVMRFGASLHAQLLVGDSPICFAQNELRRHHGIILQCLHICASLRPQALPRGSDSMSSLPPEGGRTLLSPSGLVHAVLALISTTLSACSANQPDVKHNGPRPRIETSLMGTCHFAPNYLPQIGP